MAAESFRSIHPDNSANADNTDAAQKSRLCGGPTCRKDVKLQIGGTGPAGTPRIKNTGGKQV